MTVLDVIKKPNVLLTQVCEPVTQFDDQLKQLIHDMFETMKAHDGIGLAAPQVGILQRLFICKVNTTSLVCINPKLTLSGDELVSEEGCLSIPDLLMDVPRKSHVSITAHDGNGTAYTRSFTDLMAIVIQHEFDHLEGILITDYS